MTMPRTDSRGIWAAQALTLDWDRRLARPSVEWELPFAKWFVGGRLNVAYNCLDRHVEAGHGDQIAFHWEGEPGDVPHGSRTPSCSRRSGRVANSLKSLGVVQG